MDLSCLGEGGREWRKAVAVVHLAEDLGVNLAAAPQSGVSSANKDDVAYYHDLKIHVQQDTHEFVMTCGFMDFRTDAVVGQTGFFEHYRVVFERYRKTFELTYYE